MNQLKFFLLIMMVSQTVLGKFYIRYNHLGYVPERSKELVILSEEDLVGKEWSIKVKGGKTEELKGLVGLSRNDQGPHTPFKFNYKIEFTDLKKIGDYQFELGEEIVPIIITESPYDFIPSDILRYFRVQRSGTKHTLDHKSSHSGDRRCVIHKRKDDKNDQWGLLDELPRKANMRGGWYDAGDYIKFTLTTAYSAYIMLLSYEMNPDLFQQKKYSKTDFNDLLDEASWGLEYLMKTYPKEKDFIIQVGGFLSLGAKVFQSYDSVRAKKYLDMAEKIYEKAINYKECAWVKQGWETFYADETPYDNLHLASVELYRTTKKEKYLIDAKKYSDLSNRAYWSSWGNLDNIAHLRFYEFDKTGTTKYTVEDLNFFKSKADNKTNIWGMPHPYTWGSLYSFLGVGNLSMIYKLNTKEGTYDSHYLDVLDYTLGKNNWGTAFVASEQIPNSIRNIYSQIYKLQPKRYPTGAISEGPGDRATHERLKTYFKIPKDAKEEKFNASSVVFYDLDSNFQTMETTIVGLADGLLFFTLIDLLEKENKL